MKGFKDLMAKLKRKLEKSKPSDELIRLVPPPIGCDEGPTAECTCGWKFGPTTRMMLLGIEAKEHEAKTGHQRRR